MFDSYSYSFFALTEYRLAEIGIESIFIYGSGEWAQKLTTYLITKGIKVCAIIDDGYGENHLDSIENLEIIPSENVFGQTKVIIVASYDYQDLIYDRLIAMNMPNTHIIKLFERLSSETIKNCEKYQPNRSSVISSNLLIKSILYLGDNSDLINFGCRATSLALKELISINAEKIEVVKRTEVETLFAALPLVDSILQYIQAVKNFNKFVWDELAKRIKGSDAVVLNGEGSFIFQLPPRIELYNYLVFLVICIEMKKPFFLFNCMFSGFGDNAINEEQARECFSLLRNAAAIIVRDTTSLYIAKQYTDYLNISYVPDALFSWYSFYEDKKVFFHTIHNSLKNLLPFYDFNEYDYDIDISRRYILLSGNSYVAHFPLEGYKSFLGLTKCIRNMAEELGLRLYLIECCRGDSFLRDVARDTQTPIIPVETNIRYAGYILGEARCYISGRYHPSILASLGGCPCVFMGSNSHKTLSLQNVLGIKEENNRIFSAIPDETEAIRITEYARVIMNSTDRAQIKKNCLLNENLSNAYIEIFQ